MTPAPESPESSAASRGPEGELQTRRESLRRGLRRANLASVLILAVVVLLATALVWKSQESAKQAGRAEVNALRASDEAERAQQATDRAEAELWNSRLNEVRAERYANRPGALIRHAVLPVCSRQCFGPEDTAIPIEPTSAPSENRISAAYDRRADNNYRRYAST